MQCRATCSPADPPDRRVPAPRWPRSSFSLPELEPWRLQVVLLCRCVTPADGRSSEDVVFQLIVQHVPADDLDLRHLVGSRSRAAWTPLGSSTGFDRAPLGRRSDERLGRSVERRIHARSSACRVPQVPAGWELVPGQPDVVREVIAKHRWATDVMVVGSGEAYYTLGFDHGSKAGQSCGKDRLASRGGAAWGARRAGAARGGNASGQGVGPAGIGAVGGDAVAAARRVASDASRSETPLRSVLAQHRSRSSAPLTCAEVQTDFGHYS